MSDYLTYLDVRTGICLHKRFSSVTFYCTCILLSPNSEFQYLQIIVLLPTAPPRQLCSSDVADTSAWLSLDSSIYA